MRSSTLNAIAIAVITISATSSYAQNTNATLDAAAKALSSTPVNSIQYSATGWAYNFGQAIRADLAWPANARITSYSATIDFKTPAMRVESERNAAEGLAPGATPQRQNQAVSGKAAWNVVGQNNNPALGAVNDRLQQIWTSPYGVIKAAQNAGAATKVASQSGHHVITFMIDKTAVKAVLSADNLIDRVEYMVDNAVLGDMPVEIIYANYRDFNGVNYPTHIVQKQAGHPVLDLVISSVTANAAAAIETPANVALAVATPPPIAEAKVDVQKLADGVYYLAGQSHHSVAVEFKDYVTVIDAPQSDARVTAVFDAVRKAIPNKPIRYLVNTHNHFDHSGGLRAAIAEGATLITHSSNKAYFEAALARPHTLNPDRLAKTPKKVKIEGMEDSRVLTDGTQRLELYRLQGSTHNDAILVAYLPAAKILVEVDVYTPAALPAPNAPAPAANATAPAINPTSVNLYDNIQRLKLNVEQIAPLHGRVVKMSDLLAAIGKTS